MQRILQQLLGAAAAALSLWTINPPASDAGTANRGDHPRAARSASGAQLAAPTVSIAGLNPGTSIERSECVTIAVGGGAASECGDLRLAHALPAVTTMGKLRVPTLLYNSGHAHPTPKVAALVTVPSDGVGTDSVTARLISGGVELAVGRWAGAEWGTGGARRIALVFDARYKPTGSYHYQLEVSRWAGGTRAIAIVDDDLVIVNRVDGPFGAGWALGGIEQLVFQTASRDTILWVGGDGSTRRYTQLPAPAVYDRHTYYAAPSLDHPDTLVYEWDSGWYYRKLPQGLTVIFRNAGQHLATRNRLGQTTTMGWEPDGAGGVRLYSITAPVVSGNAPAWIFLYDANGRVASIVATADGAAPRTVQLTDPFGRLTRITDPDGSHLDFGYDDQAGYGMRVVTRTDQKGALSTFAYGAGSTLARATHFLSASDSVVHTIRAQAGLATSGMEWLGFAGLPSVTPDSAFTLYDGPRLPADVADVTRFHENGFGAPVRIVNALGQSTQLFREDARWPFLVTRQVASNGFTTFAAYDARGRLDSTTAVSPYGDGRNATTRYAWDARWDLVTGTTLPEGETSTAAFDPTNGNPLWTQSRGDTTRYYSALNGLMDSVVTSDGAKDAFRYDGAGNAWQYVSPRGALSQTDRDGVGRIWRTLTYGGPSVRVQTTQFDVMDRPRVQIDSAGSDALEVRMHYDAAGAVDTVTQYARPVRVRRLSTPGSSPIVRAYRYDALGRKTAEYANGGLEKFWNYDVAGNVTSASNEPGTTLVYDAANRLVQRAGGPDSARYAYDASTGGLQDATNAFAKVRRSYYPNGALHGDTSWVADRTLTSLSAPDGIAVTYDISGRRTSVQMPAEIGRTVGFTYDIGASGTGQVATVTDGSAGGLHRFRYDRQGRLESLVRRETGASPITETRTYDIASAVRTRLVHGGGTVYANDLVSYDPLGRMVRAPDSTAYDGLGHVIYHSGGGPTEELVYDAFANRTWKSSIGGGASQEEYVYEDGANRIVKKWDGLTEDHPDTTRYNYTGDGALMSEETFHVFGFGGGGFTASTDTGTARSYRLNTYRSGKLVASHFTRDTVWIARTGPASTLPAYRSNETYRYDALGRRVWQRMVFGDYRCATLEQTTGCTSAITTTAWDGDAVLLERRTSSDSGYVAASYRQFGTVAYVHGLEIDRPLVVMKAGEHDVLPFTRTGDGKFFAGACPDALCTESDLDFPMGRASMHGAPPQWVSGSGWYGSQITGMVDGSGYIYQRNRYLDPKTGLFTQTDPIGLGGGLNTYGFAGADPVSYSDPFGLKACLPACAEPVIEELEEAAPAIEEAAAGAGEAIAARGSELARNIQQSGIARQAGEAAHHIVAKAANAAEPARQALTRAGVRINDAVNGVFLPAAKDYVGQAMNHLTLHTREYYDAVNRAMQNVQTRQEAVEVLTSIRDRLLNGSFPR